jgi:hypothetical protein
MAHLWVRHDGGDWAVQGLASGGLRLDTDPPRRLKEEIVGSDDADGILLLRDATSEGARWILLAGVQHHVRINGLPLSAGIRVLADRDEIRVAGKEPWYFSTEETAHVVDFPGSDTPIRCPRCKQPVESGMPAVRCPDCGVWHHQAPDIRLPCWTYAELCGACARQPTALEAEFRWTPVGL